MARNLNKRQVCSFILRHVEDHPNDIVTVAARRFGVSRQAIHKHLRELIGDNLIKATGNTRARRYSLRPISSVGTRFLNDDQLKEHDVWRHFRPVLTDLPENVLEICGYALSEMVNNAIDHSGSHEVVVRCTRMPNVIQIGVADSGVGIFHKIARFLKLDDDREAILDLAKGRFTTDPQNHSGEGIFFTSRLVDLFGIRSRRLYFEHVARRTPPDLLKEVDKMRDGTHVYMEVNTETQRTAHTVFDEFSTVDGGFSSTRVPVRLAKYGDDLLVSRSQAKRVLMRFEKFREVFLDFEGIDTIGQAFADEIFRVFRRQHPNVKLVAVNASDAVQSMIEHVRPSQDFLANTVFVSSAECDGYSSVTSVGLEDEIRISGSDLTPPPPEVYF